MKSHILFIRLSSLGDAILTASALEALPAGVTADWLVSAEYEDLFRGAPRIAKLWTFDRSSGREGWRQLAIELRNEGYSEIVDLHDSLRTKLMRFWFWTWRLGSKAERRASFPRWRVLRKSRFRGWGYFAFKRMWPRGLRPERLTARAAAIAGGTGQERPNFRHLLRSDSDPIAGAEGLVKGRYFCVMPSSLWKGKQWPVERFAAVVSEVGLTPVILGSSKDLGAFELVETLSRIGKPFVSGVGRWKLPEVARVLADSAGYFGNDTGLAHLAEAVGTPAFVLFGPTRGDTGFGPWMPQSMALESPLWCSPCSKDGQACFRTGNRRFQCQRALTVERVTADLNQALIAAASFRRADGDS